MKLITTIVYANSLTTDPKTGELVNDYRLRRVIAGPVPTPKDDFDALFPPPSLAELQAAIDEHKRYNRKKREILRRHRNDPAIRQWFDEK